MPIREGFVDDEAPRPRVAVEPEQDKPRRRIETPPPTIENSPAETAPRADEQWPVVVKLLYKSIRNDRGETLQEISFREPRGGDIARYGNPVRINQEGEVVIEERKMHFIMSALAGNLPPLMEQLDPRDWNSCAYRLRSFFLPDPAAW
jgi:hypothetical protein